MLGSSSELQVSVTNAKQTPFLPGETIKGTVIVRSLKTSEPQSIVAHFKGRAKTFFQRESAENSTTQRESHVFLQDKSILWRSEGLLASAPLDFAGENVFPFEFTVPKDMGLAPSFEGSHGNVSYTIKAEVIAKWQKNIKAKTKVAVSDSVQIPPIHLQQAISVHDSKSVCCFWWESDPITSELTLPHAAVLPGESLIPTLTVSNSSAQEITRIRFYLSQKVSYRAQGHVEVCFEDVLLLDHLQSIPPGKSNFMIAKEITIPTNAAADFAVADSLITIESRLKIVLVFSGIVALNQQQIHVPLRIGTVRHDEGYMSRYDDEEHVHHSPHSRLVQMHHYLSPGSDYQTATSH